MPDKKPSVSTFPFTIAEARKFFVVFYLTPFKGFYNCKRFSLNQLRDLESQQTNRSSTRPRACTIPV